MTNLEALRANISDAHGVVLNENHFVKALIDSGLGVYEIYSNSSAISLATVKLYDMILGGASLSEGSLSYSVNKAEVRKLRDDLANSLGLTESKRTVNVARVW